MANVKIAKNTSIYNSKKGLQVSLSLVCHNPTQERVGLLINRYAVMAQNGIGITNEERRELVKMKTGVWDARSIFSVSESLPAKFVPLSVDPTKGDSLKLRVSSVFYGVERHTIIDAAVPKKPIKTKKNKYHYDRSIININSNHLDSKISTLIYSFIETYGWGQQQQQQEGFRFFLANKTDQELYIAFDEKLLDEDGDTVLDEDGDTVDASVRGFSPFAANSAIETGDCELPFEKARGGKIKVDLMVYYKIHEEVNEFDIPLNQSSNDESDEYEVNDYDDDE